MHVEKSEGRVREECTETVSVLQGKDRKGLRFRMNLQEKYLTRYYNVLEWTTKSFFINPLGMSLKKLKAIESILLYKPTAVHSGDIILGLRMALLNFYNPFKFIIIWNGKIVGLRFGPWVRKIPWRRNWQSTPVFLPGKSHGQRSLVDYSPWGHKESDVTK